MARAQCFLFSIVHRSFFIQPISTCKIVKCVSKAYGFFANSLMDYNLQLFGVCQPYINRTITYHSWLSKCIYSRLKQYDLSHFPLVESIKATPTINCRSCVCVSVSTVYSQLDERGTRQMLAIHHACCTRKAV